MFSLYYKKNNNNLLFSQLEDNGFSKVQNYIPVYSEFFELSKIFFPTAYGYTKNLYIAKDSDSYWDYHNEARGGKESIDCRYCWGAII